MVPRFAIKVVTIEQSNDGTDGEIVFVNLGHLLLEAAVTEEDYQSELNFIVKRVRQYSHNMKFLTKYGERLAQKFGFVHFSAGSAGYLGHSFAELE